MPAPRVPDRKLKRAGRSPGRCPSPHFPPGAFLLRNRPGRRLCEHSPEREPDPSAAWEQTNRPARLSSTELAWTRREAEPRKLQASAPPPAGPPRTRRGREEQTGEIGRSRSSQKSCREV